jgi:esterase/lipase superfamily enzyme
MSSAAGSLSTTVYFATDRKPDPQAPGGYGAEITDKITYAVVPVGGITLDNADSGTLDTITGVQPGNFASTVAAEIEANNRNLLVFIHGFDNSFEDAITRAAFIREWYAASGVPEADTTVVAFTWPSSGQLIASLPNPPQGAYLADQRMAGLSAPHLAEFLDHVMTIAAAIPQRRIFLLAHSMGNHALASAIPRLAPRAGRHLFDEAILAAADEVHTTFDIAGLVLNPLPGLAKRITVYYSRRDVAMDLSMAVNQNIRLGYSGPDDAAKFPPGQFRSVDCTEVFDFNGLIPADATHQYYRRSETVRKDIVGLMANKPVQPGAFALSTL